jgi:holin-like protein
LQAKVVSTDALPNTNKAKCGAVLTRFTTKNSVGATMRWIARGAAKNSGARMLHAMLLLIGFQLLGDMLADSISVPVPGMVIGLVLLVGVLWLRGRLPEIKDPVPGALEDMARGLHQNLGLLFVPAGAGIIAHTNDLTANGIGLIAAVIISTTATIAITALVVGRRQAVVPAPITADGV